LKKPRKPKSKPQRSPAGGAAVARLAHADTSLGPAARSFLSNARAHPARRGASVSPQRTPGTRGGPALFGFGQSRQLPPLGAAALAFLSRDARVERTRNSARAVATDPFADRETIALLLLPFLLLATALTVSQFVRETVRLDGLVAAPPPYVTPAPSREVALSQPTLRLPPGPPQIAVPEVSIPAPAARLPWSPPAIDLPELALAEPPFNLTRLPPEIAVPELTLPAPAFALAATPPQITVPDVALAAPTLQLPWLPPEIAGPQLAIPGPALTLPRTPPEIVNPVLAAIAPPFSLPATPPSITGTPPQCLADGTFGVHAYNATRASLQSAEPARLGERLSAAAVAQTREFVIYSDKYRRLDFPMGDVAPLFGVCTDVIIRAYRAVGIDLQEHVHRARIGTGDASIDHRRTETLRRYLAKHGESLPVSTFAEDYQPGDIVSYHRPQNRGSRSHIAIVTDIIAPSGRPMIVHNRGWGPQLEDALFVDHITGHYRYRPAEDAGTQVAGNRQIATAGIDLPLRRPAPASTTTAALREKASR